MLDWALVWDLILLDICTNWGLLLLLPLDVLVLFTSWLARREGDVPALQPWEGILAAVHLVLGGTVLWFNNDVAYNLITFACWGPIIGIWWANSRRKKQKANNADKGTATTDTHDTVSKPAEEDEKPESEEAEEAQDQDEPSADGRERRRRRRRD